MNRYWRPCVGVGQSDDEDSPWWNPLARGARAVGNVATLANPSALVASRAHEWAPLAQQRLGEIKDRFTTQPAVAAIETAFLPIEAATTLGSYGLGVAEGGLQGLRESNLPLIGQGAPLTQEQRRRAGDWGVFGQHEVPELRDPFAPSEALARHEAIQGPFKPVEELLSGAGLAGVIGRGARLAGGAVASRVAPDTTALQPLAGAPHAALALGAAARAGEVLSTAPAQIALRAGIPAEAVREVETHLPEETDVPTRVLAGGLAALGGLALGAWAGSAARSAGRAARTAEEALRTAVEPPAWLDEPTRQTMRDQESILRARQGGSLTLEETAGDPLKPGPPPYPGGWPQFLVDSLRTHATDSNAYMETWTRFLREHGDDPAFYKEAQRLPGVPKQTAQFINDHVTPIFDNRGIDLNAEHVPLFDQLRFAGMAVQRLRAFQSIEERLAAAQGAVKQAEDAAAQHAGLATDADIARARAAEMGLPRLREAVDELQKQVERTPRRLGHYTTLEEAETGLKNTSRLVDETVGEGTSQRWGKAAVDFTEAQNRVLEYAAESGLFPRSALESAEEKFLIYGRLTDMETARTGDKGRPAAGARAAPTTGLYYEHSGEPVVGLSLGDDLARIARLYDLAQKNRVMLEMADASARAPETFGKFLRPWYEPRETRTPAESTEPRLALHGPTIENEPTPIIAPAGLPQPAWRAALGPGEIDRTRALIVPERGVARPDYSIVPAAKVEAGTELQTPKAASERGIPQGWDTVPVWVDGVDHTHIAPKWFADYIKGITPWQADPVTRFLAGAISPFRLGITTRSIPFILGNFPRDVQDALKNYGPGFLRYLPAAGMELAGVNLDRWYERNQNNPIVRQLPERIAKSLQNLTAKGNVREFYMERAGGTTQTETLRSMPSIGVTRAPTDAAQTLGLQGAAPTNAFGRLPGPLGGIARGVENHNNLIDAISEIGETTTRLAVYRHAREVKGMSRLDAALAGRSSTIDFSKAGDGARIASMFLPLLNARMQGTLRSIRAAQEDPEGYAARVAVTTVPPTLGAWWWNRQFFSHLYDQVPQDERDRNWVLILGSWTDEQGREQPIRLRIPKDEVSGAVSIPLEHMLDAYHRTQQGVPPTADAPGTLRLGPLAANREQFPGRALLPHQRTERDAGDMWMDVLGSMTPFGLRSQDMESAGALGMAVLGMNPIFNVAHGLASNVDRFTGRSLTPEWQQDIPPEYRYGRSTPVAYKALAQLEKAAGVPDSWRAALGPSALQFATRGLFGTSANAAMQALDIPFDMLQKAGLIPETAFRPTSPADLKLPADTPVAVADEYYRQLQQSPALPPFQRVANTFIRLVNASAAGQQTVQGKRYGISPDERRRLDETAAFNHEYTLARSDIKEKEHALLDEAKAKGWTQDAIRAKLHDFQQQREGARQTAAERHPAAYKTYQERQAAYSRLPGIPLDPVQAGTPPLPMGTDPAQLLQQYQNPPGLDPKMTRQQQYTLRQQNLAAMGRQYGMSVRALEDHLVAAAAGGRTPTEGLPNLWIEEAVNRVMSPPKVDALTPPDKRRDAQRAEVTKLAQESSVPEQRVWEMVNTRLSSPEERSPLASSLHMAQALAARIHDPQQFPRYADEHGRPVRDAQGRPSTPAQWQEWDNILEQAKSLPGHSIQATPVLAALDTAKRYGEAQRVWGLIRDEHYPDYERWYGFGGKLTVGQWEDYASGKASKYRDLPATAEGAQAGIIRDGLIKLARSYPKTAPERLQLLPEVRGWVRNMDRGWRGVLGIDNADVE